MFLYKKKLKIQKKKDKKFKRMLGHWRNKQTSDRGKMLRKNVFKNLRRGIMELDKSLPEEDVLEFKSLDSLSD